MIINKNLLDQVSEQAKASPRLRMNYNFHQSLGNRGDGYLFHRKTKSVIINS